MVEKTKSLEARVRDELILNLDYIDRDELSNYNSVTYQLLHFNSLANQGGVKLSLTA